ncbi:Serine-threonine/tyrosine-protein kinase catalytic domain [Arabidopsis suecica]|uniref:non-specific serine/threonine protein kinase n=1 Tax=Arabidopsis suecica TaxID=45249 RepID=A0A8T2BR85_ARASU|nr:Serine-threonine/tyrosine-protein kinase catalytic domain [Arabidopsis suecica]
MHPGNVWGGSLDAVDNDRVAAEEEERRRNMTEWDRGDIDHSQELFFLGFLAGNAKNPILVNENCSNARNFTKDSKYEFNLNDMLTKLSVSSNSSTASGFYTATSGVDPNIVEGMLLCIGDVSVEDCRDCVITASKAIIKTCSVQKTAITWYDNCMLRYSDVKIIGKMETVPAYMSAGTISDHDLYVKSINLMKKLIDKVNQSAQLYADEEVDGGIKLGKIHGMVQCIKGINATDCVTCLNTLVGKVYKENKDKVWWQMYGPSCMMRYKASGVTPAPTPTPVPHKPKKFDVKTILGVVAAAVAVAFLVIFCCASSSGRRILRNVFAFPKNKKGKNKVLDLDGVMINGESDESQHMRMSLDTIVDATNGFSDDNKLGEGGFGPVYKGKLPNGEDVAIKRLSKKSSQGLTEFKNEVSLIIKLQHRNLVRLLGYCFEEDEKILIYEYMSNKSLDVFLYDPLKSKELDWEKRMNIIYGMTRGLQYLHKDSRLKIIHRDLKPEENTDKIVGTIGYMSPEYALGGKISEKSDIYSFGVLLLEIISSKKANRLVSHNNQYLSLIDYAWESWCETKGLNMISNEEAMLDSSFSPAEVVKCVNIALLCLQYQPKERPTISQIADMLRSNNDGLSHPKQPSFVLQNMLNLDQHSEYEISQTTMEART